MKRIYQLAFLCFFVAASIGCNQNNKPADKEQPPSSIKTKPGATYQDSLVITASAVVLFEPDSVQLQKLKAITEERVFQSMAHEAEFQFYTVKNYGAKNRPDLDLISAKNCRWLVFLHSNKTHEVIDLDKIADAWGMYLFDPKTSAQRADMMNVDTEIPRYFSK